MASTLSINSNSSPLSLSSFVPPPSQQFMQQMPQQMPNVFVIPPEEELDTNPPWCYFDATQAVRDSLCTLPDMDAIDVALRLCQQRDNRAPAFNRSFTNESQETIVMPRKGSFMKLHEMNLEMEDGQTDIRSRGSLRRFDDEIVEVVKVRRNEGVTGVGEVRQMKKSNTFRARATQALRSIKFNVGRGQRSVSASGRRPPTGEMHVPTTLPTRQSFQQEIGPPRPMSPTVSRRRSLTLSQLFTFKENQQQPSRPTSPSDEPMSPSSPTLVSSEYIPSPRPMSPTESVASQQLRPSQSLEDCAVASSKSSTLATEPLNAEESSKPALSKRKSFRRRLSVLEIQKLFTIGSSSSPQHQSEVLPPQETADDQSVPSQSRPKSMDFTSLFSASSSRISTASASASTVVGDIPSRWSSSSARMNHADGGGENAVDAELEMRLDSLHFDSLHFDPDEILSLL